MNYSPDDFVTPEYILAEVLPELDEEKHLFITKGGFVSQIRKCLEALSFSTFFNEVTHMEEVPENLRMKVPQGMFNLRRMYLFNGEECDINDSVIVRHKRHFFRKGGGPGYLANNKGRDQRNDVFFRGTNPQRFQEGVRRGQVDPGSNIGNRRQRSYFSDYTDLYFYEIQSGIIMLSDNCSRYERIALVFNSIMDAMEEVPCIPKYLREVVKDWCVVYGARIKRTKDKENRNLWNSVLQEASQRLGREYYNPHGSWIEAERRVKAIDSKEREDLKEYMSKLDY